MPSTMTLMVLREDFQDLAGLAFIIARDDDDGIASFDFHDPILLAITELR
jgi:hypothetical protein